VTFSVRPAGLSIDIFALADDWFRYEPGSDAWRVSGITCLIGRCPPSRSEASRADDLAASSRGEDLPDVKARFRG
jgi:hypothetical protein